MRTLLAREPDIDAVFVCSDQMAVGALGVAHQTGRSIPQDLAVVGFDNIPEAAYFWPPLTTVNQQLIDVGCLAVQNLHAAIEAKRTGAVVGIKNVQLTPQLIVRGSSALAAG
jgi:DNA-binding LacI/PurR family transcriptional regulator